MKSKGSYFSISLPLIKENIRRFWAIPVVSFLVYFLSGVFPALMSYNNINNMANYIEMSLRNMQPFYMAAHLLMPVITAVILYRYLQSVSSVAVMHSLPFTRAKLFNSNFVSGIILTITPILLNGIILLLVSKPTYKQWGYGPDMTIDTINVFARGEIVNWIWTSLIIVLVVYSISVFAGIVTGNNLMHLFISFFFIFVITILYAVFNLYFDTFLYGFNLSGNWMDICLAISPFTGILNAEGYFSALANLYYIGTFVLMFVISAILYNKRKLERATDSLTFDFMKPIICYIIAFLGMTLLGFYFEVLGDDRMYMYTGFAAGTVIFFIIGQMIVTKSVRIFNKNGLITFLIYTLIAVLFIIGLNIDATGYEKRIPNPEKVESAIITDNFNNILSYYQYDDDKLKLESPENLNAITEFHNSIIENRNRFENSKNNLYSSFINLKYDSTGIFDMNRQYNVDYEFYANSTAIAQVFESLEYKAIFSLYNLGADEFENISVYGDAYHENPQEITSKNEIDELIACLEKDFRNMSFDDFISLKRKYARVEITYDYTDEDAIGRKDKTGYVSYKVPYSSTNTIEWLEEQGYNFGVTPEMVEEINIYSADQEYQDPYYYKERATMDSVNRIEIEPLMQIKDKDSIEKILNTYDDRQINFNEAYRVEIKINADESYDGYEYITGYLNEGIDFLN